MRLPFAFARNASVITGCLVLLGVPAAAVGLPQAAPAPAPAPCTGQAPITCHLDLAPGNYLVTAQLGGATAGVTTIGAEARRVMLAPVATSAGQLVTHTVTVNVRQPEGQPTGQGGTGTPGLDLVFGGSAPRLAALTVTAAPTTPRLFLAGDSTVCDQPTAPYTGWGQALPQYFTAGLAVANYADSGESSGSFLATAALFPTMEPLIRAGDTVLIQFGHNDKTTTADTYQRNLTTLVNRVRARGGQPVLVTPTVRRLFGADGRLTATARHVNSIGVDLPAAMKTVATRTGTPLIDLTSASTALLESLGPTASERLFLTQATDGVTDNTHFSAAGADAMARLVIAGITAARLPVAGHLRLPLT